MKIEKLDLVGIFVVIIIIAIVMYMIGYTRGHRVGWDDHREAIKPSYLNWSDF